MQARPGAALISKTSRLAVLQASKAINSQAGITASDIFTMKLLNGGFDVVERERIEAIVVERKIEFEGENINKATEVGSLVGAQCIILLSVGEVTVGQQVIPGGVFKRAKIESVTNVSLTAKAIDVKTSKVIWVAASTTQDRSLQQCVSRCCDALSDKLLGKSKE